jgi:phosphatidate phosphatase APP1
MKLSNSLSFMHLNTRSIVNKFDSFKQFINSFNIPFQVIGLTETWLNDIKKLINNSGAKHKEKS